MSNIDGSVGSAAGGCLCGAVRFRVTGPLDDVVLCHCRQCRATHGHVAAYTRTAARALELDETRGLAWFRSSGFAERGFCRECGASLFWKADDGNAVSIAAGCLDAPTGLKSVRHLFVVDKGDYYDLADALPRFDGPFR